MRTSFLWAACIPVALCGQSNKTLPARPELHGFLENKGQVVDLESKSNNAVAYLLGGASCNVQLRAGGFSYDLWRPTRSYTDEERRAFEGRKALLPLIPVQMHRIDIDLTGADLSASVTTEGRSEAHANYYTIGTPAGGVTDVHSYATVTYHDVYPAIDVRFMTTGPQGFKYDFILHPGANVEDIRLRVRGAGDLALKDGAIQMATRFGQLEERIPECSWRSSEGSGTLKGQFVRTGAEEFGIHLTSYPKIATVVVDPVPTLVWGTFYGGPDDSYLEEILSLDLQPTGLYFGGHTTSASSFASGGAYQQTYGGMEDGFFGKFSGNALAYCSYFGGSREDLVTNISGQDVFIGKGVISGQTLSLDNISFNDYDSTSCCGMFMGFFDLGSGYMFTARYFAAREHWWNNLIVKDGYVYICGFDSPWTLTEHMVTPGAFQSQNNGPSDAFVAKYNAEARHVEWCTLYGGSGSDRAHGIAVDDANDVYLTGETDSPALATPGAMQPEPSGSFVTKFSGSTGQPVWSSYLGGPETPVLQESGTRAAAIATYHDRIYIAGTTTTTTFRTTPYAQQTTYGGGHSYMWSPYPMGDGFLMQMDTAGSTLNWSTFYGSADPESFDLLAVNFVGDVYISGLVRDPVLTTAGAFDTIPTGGTYTPLITKFNGLSGLVQWSTFWGDGLRLNQIDSHVGFLAFGGLAMEPTPQPVTPDAYMSAPSLRSSCYMAEIHDCFSFPDAPANVLGDTLLCPHANAVQLSVEAPDPGLYYMWSVPSGAVVIAGQGTPNALIDLGTATNPIIVRGRNQCGLSQPAYFTYSLYQSGPLNVTAQGPTTLCAGDSVQLIAIGPAGYTWEDGSNAPDRQISTSGSYYVTYSDDVCQFVSDTIYVTVVPLPDLELNGPTEQEIFSTSSYTVTSSLDNTCTFTVDHGHFIYVFNHQADVIWNEVGTGLLIATATDVNGCSTTDTLVVTITSPDAVEEAKAMSSLTLYPIPASTELYVRSGSVNPAPIALRVSDAQGRCVRTMISNEDPSTVLEVDVSDLPNGLYCLQIQYPKTTATGRFVVQR